MNVQNLEDSQCESKAYHHGDLRQTLIDAACEHLKIKSTHELSLRGLARDIGVSQTAPYRHFESKSALFEAIAVYGFELLTQAVTVSADLRVGGPQEVLVQQGLAYIKWAEENPEKYQLSFDSSLGGSSADPALQKAGVESFSVVLKTLEIGIEEGVFIDKPVIELGALVWSFVHGTASLLIGKGDLRSSTNRQDVVTEGIASVETNRESNIRLFVSALVK